MSKNTDKKIVTRFAPSPTGFMHVGGVRTALYAWLWAKKTNGSFILRIEDTDKEREVEGSIEHIKKSLKWLGLDWDEGPDKGGPHGSYIQSERLDLYKKYADILIKKGLAYADTSTEEDINVLRKKAEDNKTPFLFREHRPKESPVWDGTQSLRFKVLELKRYIWNDLVWGELSAGPEALDDFIIIKSDGYPTYNFAHIVDDIEMGVTHVMRGQEFISSMPKFLSVYEALDVTPPNFATLPPIMAPGGQKKLGKRDGAKDLLEYEKEGYLPEAMVNFLVLLGWNPGDDREIFNREELIKTFDLSKIQRSGAQLSDDKLNWINKEHLKLLPISVRNEKIVDRLNNNSVIADKDFLLKLCPTIFDHISKWGDIDEMVRVGELDYFFEPPKYEVSLLYWKGEKTPEETKEYLSYVLDVFNKTTEDQFASIETIKNLIFDYATKIGRGQVLWPLRVSLSGKEKSPDPFTLVFILGKEETLNRIRSAIENLK